jgi:hypothetical protein
LEENALKHRRPVNWCLKIARMSNFNCCTKWNK